MRYMMPTPLAWSTAASDINAARNIEISAGASPHPCFTPVLMLNDPDCSPSYSTHPLMYSGSCRVMLTHLGGHPSRARHVHRAYLFTESNTLVCSINAKQRTRPFFTRSITCIVCLSGKRMMVMDVQLWIEKGNEDQSQRTASRTTCRATRHKTHVALMFAFIFILVRCFIKDQLKKKKLNLGPFQILSFRSPIR